MVSIKSVSTKHASHYYTKEGEYAGHWFGKGAEALGLIGEVKPEDFSYLIQGKDLDGSDLVPPGGEKNFHRAGFDMTFSAPKSVSFLAEVMDKHDVREAAEAAAIKTYERLEQKYSQCRITVNGVTQKVNTGNLVIASFPHNTSRSLDPHLHYHGVIMNLTQNGKGEWRALNAKELYDTKMEIGQYFRSELAKNLTELGYGIRSTGNGMFEVAGVPQELIDLYSKRSGQIKEYVRELKEKGLFIDANEAKLKSTVCIKTRNGKEYNVNAVDLKTLWIGEMGRAGYTKDQIEDALAMEFEKGIEEAKNHVGMSEYDYVRKAAEILTEKSVVFSRQDIIDTAAKLSVGKLRISDIEKAVAGLSMGGHRAEIIRHEDGKYSTKEMYQSERAVVGKIRHRKGTMEPVYSKEKAEKIIESKYGHLKQGVKDAVTHILTSPDNYIAINGRAGAGKSTMLKTARAELEKEGYIVRGFAPTGQAAKIIEEKTELDATTLHSLLLNIDKKTVVNTREELEEYKEKYQKIKELLPQKEWADMENPVYVEDMKKQIGLKSLIINPQVKESMDGSTVTVKSATMKNAFKNRVKDSFKNMLNRIITNTFNPQHVRYEKNSIKNVYKKDELGDVKLAKQVTRVEVYSSSWEHKKVYKNYTFYGNGDIYVNTNDITDIENNKFGLIKNPNSIIVKNKEIWAIDESSMVDSKMFIKLIDVAEKVGAKLVYVGDVTQIQPVGPGKLFLDLIKKGVIEVKEMKENLRQINPKYKEVADLYQEKKIDEAFTKMKEYGMLQESNNVVGEAIKDYIHREDWRDTVVVTPLNKTRMSMNDKIHDGLREKGELQGEEYTFVIKEAKSGGDLIDKHFAENFDYKGKKIVDKKEEKIATYGDVVVLNGKIGNLKPGMEGVVIGADEKNNIIKIKDKKGREHTIDLTRDADKIAIYEQREIKLSQGDRIVCLKNNSMLGVTNGLTGEIQKIDKKGNLEIKTEEGEVKKFNISRDYGFINHGYVLTPEKSQGMEAKNVVGVIDKSISPRVNYNLFKVMMSRGEHGLKIYADNVEKLQEQVKHEQKKDSTLDYQDPYKDIATVKNPHTYEITKLQKYGYKDNKVVEKPIDIEFALIQKGDAQFKVEKTDDPRLQNKQAEYIKYSSELSDTEYRDLIDGKVTQHWTEIDGKNITLHGNGNIEVGSYDINFKTAKREHTSYILKPDEIKVERILKEKEQEKNSIDDMDDKNYKEAAKDVYKEPVQEVEKSR